MFLSIQKDLFLTLPVPIPSKEKKLTYVFIFTLCGEAPQRNVKIKLSVNIYFNITLRNAWGVMH